MPYDCGVAITVPLQVKEEALRLTDELERLHAPLVYRLGGDAEPHITLFQGRFADEREAYAAWKQSRHIIFFHSIRLLAQLELRSNGNVFWNVYKDRQLTDLHKVVAASMQRHTGNKLRDPEQLVYQSATGETSERIMKYGAVASGDFYHPHVTLGRVSSTRGVKFGKLILPARIKFSAERLCFGPINEFGQIFASQLESVPFVG